MQVKFKVLKMILWTNKSHKEIELQTWYLVKKYKVNKTQNARTLYRIAYYT
jgi:hypothetical protein